VTTARVTHATPAALYAHTCDREWECDKRVPNGTAPPEGTHDIAWQLVRNKPGNATNVVMGGGLAAFVPESDRQKFAERVGHTVSLLSEFNVTLSFLAEINSFLSFIASSFIIYSFFASFNV